VDADTLFDSSATEDLNVGRDVQMVGVDLRNGTTRTRMVVVYEGNRPVRMGNGKVMPVSNQMVATRAAVFTPHRREQKSQWRSRKPSPFRCLGR